MILTEALDRFYQSMIGVKSPQTVIWYQRKLLSLNEILGDRACGAVTIWDLNAWRAMLATKQKRYTNHPYRGELDGGISPLTLHGHVRACRRFFTWLVEQGELEHSPAEKLEKPPKPKIVRDGLPVRDRDAMLAAAERNPRDLALCLFLADTAVRRGGVAGLQLADIDIDRRRAIVREKGLGGKRKERIVFFGPRTEQALRAWLAVRPVVKSQRVFLAYEPRLQQYVSRGITEGGVNLALKRIAKRAHVTSKYNPHSWRHGSSRGMIRRKMPLGVVSQILGHSSVAVTSDIYGTLDEDALQQAHADCGWLNS
jgi:integrase/recombinase XerC